MSNPNPLVPQGSLLEQQAKSKSTFQVAAFIVALHVVILGGLLFLGCKKEEKLTAENPADALISPPAVTGASNGLPADPFAMPSNAIVAVPEPGTNSVPPVVYTPTAPTTPILSPEPGAGTAPGMTEHVVQKGDAAYKVAKKHGVTLKQLQDANPGVDLAKLKLNQKIFIPAASASAAAPVADLTGGAAAPAAAEVSRTTHTVKGGDNLSRIAKKYGVSVKEIRAANGMKSNDIKVGQKLKIPAPSSAKGETKTSAPADAVPAPVVTPGKP